MVIGRGRRGSQLRVATWLQLEVCAKILPWDPTAAGTAELEELHAQLHLRHSLRHPNLVAFLGACLSVENPPVVLYELLPQNLDEFIQISKKRAGPRGEPGLPMASVTGMGLDVARALHYLHHCGVSHGTLSTKKVMVTASGRGKLVYSPGQDPIAPAEQLGPAGDLYYMGLMLCEMATGRKPDPNEIELAYKEVADPRLREVVRRCLEERPEERPNTDELVGMLKMLRN